MLDFERIFKIKVRLRWTVFEISLTSAITCIERVLHGYKIVQYLQNYKRHESDKVIQESPYRVLKVHPYRKR